MEERYTPLNLYCFIHEICLILLGDFTYTPLDSKVFLYAFSSLNFCPYDAILLVNIHLSGQFCFILKVSPI